MLRKKQPLPSLILNYHRISEPGSDPWNLCVTPLHFREHLEILRSSRLKKMKDFGNDHTNGNLHSGTVAITFDDGYADNLLNAGPLLEEFGAPATFFIVTGQIGKEREFWWDDLERILLVPESLPETLDFIIRRRRFVARLRTTTDRHAAYQKLWGKLLRLQESERQEILEQLFAWAGIQRTVRPTHRTLTQDEVCGMDRMKLFEFGAHSYSHVLLSAISAESQKEEINASKIELERLLGHEVNSFAYPYGGYSREAIRLVRNAGFKNACTTKDKAVTKRSNIFQLPRIAVRNWDGDRFSKFLWEHS